jgi:glycosyltransferase involved in cell wall biosynthesis
LGASSRLRCFDLLPYWEEAGFEVEVSPFFDDGYIVRRYRGERQPKSALLRYYRQRRAALARDDADLLWLQVELFPFLPYGVERRYLEGKPYVLDLDDAWFHRYDRHPSPMVRRLLGGKIAALMAKAALVVCANDYLATAARQAGARRVKLSPTALDSGLYAKLPPPEGDPPVIGWIGAPRNLAYLEPIAPLLTELVTAGRARLLLVSAKGALPSYLAEIPHAFRLWREETELEALSEMDIGVMPLPDNDWERGKSGFKLIQYMAAGRAAVASPVGANRTISEDGRSALLAEGPQEWRACLERLLEQPELRRQLGSQARRRVAGAYDRATAGRAQALWFRESLTGG